MRPEEAVVVPLPVAPGAGLTLSPQELAAFAGLVAAGHQAALVLYLLELRPFVDGRTGVVGDARRVSEQAFIERLEVPASQGRSRSRPSRDFIQRQISALVSVGLLERLRSGRRCDFFSRSQPWGQSARRKSAQCRAQCRAQYGRQIAQIKQCLASINRRCPHMSPHVSAHIIII